MAKNIQTNWILSSLFRDDNDPRIEKKRKEAKVAAYKFINKWKDRDDYLKKPGVLMQAFNEYEDWLRSYGPGASEWYYFALRSYLNQNDPKIKARLNQIIDFGQKIENDIQFFELRIGKIDPRLHSKFLNYKPLAPYKHLLEKLFRFAKYQLSEPEEKIMNLKDTTSYANWVRMTSSLLSKEERQFINSKGKKEIKNFSEVIGLIDDKNKKVRDDAAKAFNDILAKYVEVGEHELNSVLQYKKVNDELRKYNRPDQARHLADDIESKTVDIVTKSVSKRFDISKRYYRLKAKLLGIKKLEYHERNLEYGNLGKKYSFGESINIVRSVFEKLDDEFVKIFDNFIENGQIDVYPKKGKQSGASCTYNLITHPVYILLNYNNKLDDVRTFAHEFGHAINDELTRKKQNALNFGTPTSTAEVASTFFEDFVIQHLIANANDEQRLSLMMSKLNQDISSIFRQIAFYNFESDLHSDFRKTGYLSKEHIGLLFQKHMASYLGNFVELSPGSENWWLYVSHFRSFFYVYSYASGLLISKYLQEEAARNPKFISTVKEFLSTGLSDSPKEMFKKAGVNIENPDFWEKGLNKVDTLLKETEVLAKKLNKI